MDKYVSVICAVGGAAFGAFGGYLTYLVSRHRAKNSPDSVNDVMVTNFLRMLIDFAVLLIAFLVCRLFDLPYFVTLIAVAFGLTVCGILLLYKLSKKLLAEAETADKNGGE